MKSQTNEQKETYLFSADARDGNMLLKVAIVRATLFNAVLQHFSMNSKTISPLFSPEAQKQERSSKSFSSLPLFISRN